MSASWHSTTAEITTGRQISGAKRESVLTHIAAYPDCTSVDPFADLHQFTNED